jgi:hypothetical protein
MSPEEARQAVGQRVVIDHGGDFEKEVLLLSAPDSRGYAIVEYGENSWMALVDRLSPAPLFTTSDAAFMAATRIAEGS